MSGKPTKFVLLAIDMLGTAVFVNRFGVTVSSWAHKEKGRHTLARHISCALERMKPGHGEEAVAADIKRAQESIAYLESSDTPGTPEFPLPAASP